MSGDSSREGERGGAYKPPTPFTINKGNIDSIYKPSNTTDWKSLRNKKN
jgi:hypothetical protein